VPEQFKNIENFRTYQKQIYDYINQEIIQIPLFFDNQPYLNDTTIPANVMRKGGVAQQTIRDGSLQYNRKINESIISFKDVYSENKDDLNIIQLIANKLNGEPPSPQNLIIDAYIWDGGLSIDSFKGPIVNDPEFYTPPTTGYMYIPFIGFVGRDEKFLLRNDSNYPINHFTTTLQNIPGIGEVQFETFKNYLKQLRFNFDLPAYNLSDNTGVFLPVGVKKRTISKKLLRQNSETEFTEIVPDGLQTKIDNFFRAWSKSRNFIPEGQEYIIGNTMLNNGDFGGAIGPGSSYFIGYQNAQANWKKLTTSNYMTLTNAFFNEARDVGQGLYPDWDGSSGQYEDLNRQSQRIEEKENPGFSPFVFSSTRSTPAWYDIQILSDELSPGVSYTFSLWHAEDEDFNPNNYLEQQLGNTFFYAVTIIDRATNGTAEEVSAVNWAEHTYSGGGESDFIDFSNPEEYVSRIQGESIENFQSPDLLWVRYKKTITLPEGDDGTLLATDGTTYNTTDYKYKIYWLLGFQNSLTDVVANSFDSRQGLRLFPGPDIRANSNKARQYFCGLRFNRGDRITGTNSIQLTTPQSKTIARILNDCVDILEPYDFDLPIYSKSKLDQIILSQQASSTIIQLLTEIKEGLISSVTSLTAGISDTYETLATNIANITDDTDTDTITELGNIIEDFRDMFDATQIAQRVDQLNTNLTDKFNLLTANTIAQPLQKISIFPTIQKLPGDFGQRAGFIFNRVGFVYANNQTLDGANLEETFTEQLNEFAPVWSNYGTKFQFPGVDTGILIGGSNVAAGYTVDYLNDAVPVLGYSSTTTIQTPPSFLTQNDEQTNTPIGAMYASEVYTSDDGLGQTIREGNPNDDNGYPSVSYGPYAQQGGPDYGFGTTGGGVERCKAVQEAYYATYQFNEPDLVSADTTETFLGMNGTNGYINSNFEPLRTYLYKCTSGLDFVAWVYSHFIASGTSFWNIAGGTYPGYPFPAGDNPKGARGMGFYNMYQYDGTDPNQYRKYDGVRTFLLYEPHWEWNGRENRWVFRFAQPVIGTNSTANYPDASLTTASGETKYKFKNMHFRKAV
tara:strand:- start:8702 stop:11914 length:3213 start_codon:yes stop_codon:yes gene_type:complete